MLGKGGGRLRLCVLPDCAQNPPEATRRKVGVALCGGGAVALMGGTTPESQGNPGRPCGGESQTSEMGWSPRGTPG